MPADAYAARWQALLPRARIATVAHAGHMLPYEQPEAVTQYVKQFLAEGAIAVG